MKLILPCCLAVFAGVAATSRGAGPGREGEDDQRGTDPAGTFALTAPLEHQVIQRPAGRTASVTVAGRCRFPEGSVHHPSLEASLTIDGRPGSWQALSAEWEDATFRAPIEVPVGGWHRLEVRATIDGHAVGSAAIEHFGVGEIFVVAGQSNAANHGEEKQRPATGRVVSFDGQRWRPAVDPQPGASGGGGSFLPPLGDAIVQRFDVPVGFVACAIGATSVREWLPEGSVFPNPPTIESRVRPRGDGRWESKGEAFRMFTQRMKPFGMHGFRAVLWHQGESDANQADPTRTLPGTLYREYLGQLIRESRRAIGWDAPWLVAQASYHVPGDEGSPDIREAQASLWHEGIALEGPDTDALKGEFRQDNGQGVHFSGPGLRAHADRWAAKIGPWLEAQLD